jgi:putative methionine-R-sulfoxide reductase with GAF domain
MTQAERHDNYASWTEVTYWLLAAFLIWYAHGVLAPVRTSVVVLYVLAVALGVVTSAAFRIMPHEITVGRFRYQAEDKFLSASLLVVVILTAYVFLAYGAAADLEYLYFVPIVLSALMLNEKIILAETSFALVAVTFLQVAYGYLGLATGHFAVRAAVLAIAGLISFKLTVELRERTDQSNKLLTELSRRLDQIQAVSVIVHQVEFFSHLDTLLQRIVESLAGVFGVERVGIFLRAEGGIKLEASYCTDCVNAQSGLEVSEGQGLFRATLDSGEGSLVRATQAEQGGFKAFAVREMLIIPLRAHDKNIGVAFVANKIHGQFADSDLDFLGMLGGYIAALVDSSQSFQAVSAEREKAERMLKLMVGREIRMRELKNKLGHPTEPEASV